MCSGTTLYLEGAEFQYPDTDKKVIKGIDLEIRAGEWIALLGPNGSGKSTLLKLFNALLLPSQGCCFIDGMDTKETMAVETIRSKVSIVFQNPEDQIVASIVEEDTAFGPENLGLPSGEIVSRVKEALTGVGLWEKRKHSVSSLSGGQKQRLALAGVLAIRPGALLLDESMSMLDPASRKSFLDLIKRAHSSGCTIVQVTHRLDEILNSDRTVVVSDGRISWQGKTEQFLSMSEDGLKDMGFAKPTVTVLKEELVKFGIIPVTTKSDIREIREKICLLQ
ncbi:MAG: ATP-binding cassette domain-containing protein [Synergistaceae bacterium]|nr:ATP-binding cassette domain-containing protein [Synergistaceae bacterium]